MTIVRAWYIACFVDRRKKDVDTLWTIVLDRSYNIYVQFCNNLLAIRFRQKLQDIITSWAKAAGHYSSVCYGEKYRTALHMDMNFRTVK
jgi:hypothetical protein